MQQEMDPRESQRNWEPPLYGASEGSPQYKSPDYNSYGQGLPPQAPIPGYSSSQYPAGGIPQQGAPFNFSGLPRGKASSGQRLALAIVSVVMLVPLSAISIAVGGFFALALICIAVTIINVAFNLLA